MSLVLKRRAKVKDRINALPDALLFTYTDDLSHVDGWLCTSIRRNVVELDFELCQSHYSQYGEFELPHSLFTCRTLTVLKLSSNCITYAPPTLGCFPSLKFLNVTVHYPDTDSIEKLITCCPILENLNIDGILRCDVVSDIHISVPTLKTLSINLSVDRQYHDYNLLINGPKLENIDFKQDLSSNYSLEHSKSLVKANIVLKEVPCRVVALLEAISNVKYLSLSAERLKKYAFSLFRVLFITFYALSFLSNCSVSAVLHAGLTNSYSISSDCSININDLRDSQRHDMWVPLQNIKTGRLHLAVTVVEDNVKVPFYFISTMFY
ncbi:FBD-associated F-box protein [Pyrus ussuriensis x Pyrus communis]|uniref:FBD-associated F-box protein n=1 Tax=Pyrus ussuriensis x Pyrus communis TaxID=2448454 RepID=A0A5N5HBJ6_9ROSA|nr:FBD-associated F-box protein [Pyrus ussuriensis x Pyrus communis]